MATFPKTAFDLSLVGNARFNGVLDRVISEVQSGTSGHWDMPWDDYLEERARDLDLYGAVDDRDPGERSHGQGDWQAYCCAVAGLKRAARGLGPRHAANRRRWAQLPCILSHIGVRSTTGREWSWPATQTERTAP